jgi:hydroxymethylbilane synthase
MAQTRPVRIGARGSRLAQWQAGAIRAGLCVAHGLAVDEIELVVIKTSGDRIRDRALAEAGGKGLFTREIEGALRCGDIDIAVHSAKDMETVLPDGLMIGAVLEREDPRDALIARDIASLEALPRGALIGSASIRRQALLRRVRPDLKFALLRGNVPTRLKRIADGNFDATLLAAAGLKRLGLEDRISALLPLDDFLPACGQGAVIAECRADDTRTRDLVAAIDHRESALAIACERAFLAALDGSCRTPIAGHARLEGNRLWFNGMLLSEDGSDIYEASVAGASEEAVPIGAAAGNEILRRAPASVLKKLGIG